MGNEQRIRDLEAWVNNLEISLAAAFGYMTSKDGEFLTQEELDEMTEQWMEASSRANGFGSVEFDISIQNTQIIYRV